MLTIHHLNNSRSQRILWLLEELEVPYEIKFYQRDPKTMLAPESLRRIHPLGKSPVLTEGDQIVAESAVIMEYILEKYGRGRLEPQRGTKEWWRFNYWMHYAEGSAMTPLLLTLIFQVMPRRPMPFFMRPIVKAIADKALNSFVRPQLKLHLDYMEKTLEENEWFSGGEFSAADIQMSFPVEAADSRGGLNSSRPKLMAYLHRIHARPAYQRALSKGGPYELMA